MELKDAKPQTGKTSQNGKTAQTEQHSGLVSFVAYVTQFAQHASRVEPGSRVDKPSHETSLRSPQAQITSTIGFDAPPTPTSFSPSEPVGVAGLSIHAQGNNTYETYIYPYEDEIRDVDRDVDRDEEGHFNKYDRLRSTPTRTVEKPNKKVV